MPIPLNPTYFPKDVTAIIPTIKIDFKKLRQTIESMLLCHLSQILLVTQESEYATLEKFANSINADNLRVLKVPAANKRRQLCQAIPLVKTKIIVLADDDVKWPSTILPWLLAPFENPKIGGVGTCQRVERLEIGPIIKRCWNWFGRAYIERRNFEISATHWIDGGTSCMSGRTHAIRTEILNYSAFLSSFQEERWGKHLLNADDDNFVTRWLFANGWKTWVQYNQYCEIETTLENNSKFLKQCSRWARSNWRSNLKTLIQGLWR
jgi:cellulose synthase/poly-beta-1,6-N-acetylglucosamine synthase-like glycosyltransferase